MCTYEHGANIRCSICATMILPSKRKDESPSKRHLALSPRGILNAVTSIEKYHNIKSQSMS